MKDRLIELAHRYNTPEFIKDDPVQFPREWAAWKQNAEIVGFIAAIFSLGNRKVILKDIKRFLEIINEHCTPLEYIKKRLYLPMQNDKRSVHRMITYHDMYEIFEIFYKVYSDYDSLEDLVLEVSEEKRLQYTKALAYIFKKARCVPKYNGGSAQKRLCMFLRWMVRDDGIVDLGIWSKLDKKKLIVPIDVHVAQMSCELGLVPGIRSAWDDAVRITGKLKEIFPDDPLLGDFALFGAGINSKILG